MVADNKQPIRAGVPDPVEELTEDELAWLHPHTRSMNAIDAGRFLHLAQILDESAKVAEELGRDDGLHLGELRDWYAGRAEMARQAAQMIRDRVY